jgi:hypothetical protein
MPLYLLAVHFGAQLVRSKRLQLCPASHTYVIIIEYMRQDAGGQDAPGSAKSAQEPAYLSRVRALTL